MKKPSSRGQRGGSKGIKGKHILQICVLLGVCIWLIYQVKYSHEKKKEFYEKDGMKSVLISESKDGLVKLGRKDLLPKHVEEDEDEEDISNGGEEKESKSKEGNDNHEEEKEDEVEEEEVVEEDEEDKNKQGEEVVEEDEEENKHEEDEIDEQDQSKNVEDTDKDDEILEEEKETNHADEIDEAREEHYRDDDASSAVSHESRLLNSEKLKESYENNVNATNREVEMQKEPFVKFGEAERGDFMNKTTTQLNSESSSSETKDTVTESQDVTVDHNSTVAILEASGLLQKETQIMRDRSQVDDAMNLVEKTRNESSPNITISANITNKDFIKDESRNESSLLQSSSGSNTTEVNESSRSESESSNNLFSTEQTEEADETSENSISQEEMEALTDTQTLPDIRTEGSEEDEEEAIAAE